MDPRLLYESPFTDINPLGVDGLFGEGEVVESIDQRESLAIGRSRVLSHNQVPEELRTLFDRQLAGIRLPKDRRLWPHPAYVRRHREAYFSA
jgi:hypothetical protein